MEDIDWGVSMLDRIKKQRKLKIYLDTSVISYLDQDNHPEKKKDTQLLWDLLRNDVYDVYISDIVVREIGQCEEKKRHVLFDYLKQINFTLVQTNNDTIQLAEKIIDFGVLKEKSYDDCQHIATAILANCDIITSWNFKHIVNVKTIQGVKIITTLEHYKDLLILSPSVLLQEEEENENETTDNQ